MKKLLSALLVTAFITTTLTPKKANAGVLVGVAPPFVAGCTWGGNCFELSLANYSIGMLSLPIGGVILLSGVITAFFNPAIGIGLMVLSEDGSLPQNDLEAALAQKYPFIQDNKVIADLATLIKSKAESQRAVDGKKMISLSEAEVKSVLESTDLLETHASEVQSMIEELI